MTFIYSYTWYMNVQLSNRRFEASHLYNIKIQCLKSIGGHFVLYKQGRQCLIRLSNWWGAHWSETPAADIENSLETEDPRFHGYRLAPSVSCPWLDAMTQCFSMMISSTWSIQLSIHCENTPTCLQLLSISLSDRYIANKPIISSIIIKSSPRMD